MVEVIISRQRGFAPLRSSGLRALSALASTTAAGLILSFSAQAQGQAPAVAAGTCNFQQPVGQCRAMVVPTGTGAGSFFQLEEGAQCASVDYSAGGRNKRLFITGGFAEEASATGPVQILGCVTYAGSAPAAPAMAPVAAAPQTASVSMGQWANNAVTAPTAAPTGMVAPAAAAAPGTLPNFAQAPGTASPIALARVRYDTTNIVIPATASHWISPSSPQLTTLAPKPANAPERASGEVVYQARQFMTDPLTGQPKLVAGKVAAAPVSASVSAPASPPAAAYHQPVPKAPAVQALNITTPVTVPATAAPVPAKIVELKPLVIAAPAPVPAPVYVPAAKVVVVPPQPKTPIIKPHGVTPKNFGPCCNAGPLKLAPMSPAVEGEWCHAEIGPLSVKSDHLVMTRENGSKISAPYTARGAHSLTYFAQPLFAFTGLIAPTDNGYLLWRDKPMGGLFEKDYLMTRCEAFKG